MDLVFLFNLCLLTCFPILHKFTCVMGRCQEPTIKIYFMYSHLIFLVSRKIDTMLFICKGPQPLCCGIHSQRTAVLFFAIHLQGPLSLYLLFICKGPLSLSGAIYLQRTAVLVLCYSFAKDCGTYFVSLVCRKKPLFLLSICCPGKIRWTATLAKHGETAFPSGFVKMAVTQIST